MNLHAVTRLFPPMSTEEFRALVTDIKEHGQREPIWTYRGEVIDGAHRLAACKELGVKVRSQEWDGKGSLTAFVLSLNLHRRHLSQGQKAMVGAEALPLFEAEAKARQLATLKRGDQKPDVALLPPREKARAREQAAAAVGVSPRYVQTAKKLQQVDPQAAEAVKRGDITLSKAVRKSVPAPKPVVQTADKVLLSLVDSIEGVHEQRKKFKHVAPATLRKLRIAYTQLDEIIHSCEGALQ